MDGIPTTTPTVARLFLFGFTRCHQVVPVVGLSFAIDVKCWLLFTWIM